MNPGASFVIEITFPCALIGQRVELSLSGYPFSPPLIAADLFAASVAIVTIRVSIGNSSLRDESKWLTSDDR
ncbi:MAG: hypothetical protein DMF38_08675 [Verrucomicrobia bacterium]|nr:MAG: hypothetical protein DME78_00650 [Verrucomicrobiota bacterium]PYL34316.1 MAG: hypothetical protein DMF38_08675 [Verrucomicrobiota bacterium]